LRNMGKDFKNIIVHRIDQSKHVPKNILQISEKCGFLLDRRSLQTTPMNQLSLQIETLHYILLSPYTATQFTSTSTYCI